MLTNEEKETILADFPQNIKLSYENIVHKKVSNFSFLYAVPQGKKTFAWFQFREEKPVCYLLELQGKQKEISDIKMVNACFDESLSYGTLFYGTQFHYQKQAFYSIEDIFYYQGQKVHHESWDQKLMYLKKIVEKQMKQVSYQSNFIVFGLPLMDTDYDRFMKKMEVLPYNIHGVYMRNTPYPPLGKVQGTGVAEPKPLGNSRPNYNSKFISKTNKDMALTQLQPFHKFVKNNKPEVLAPQRQSLGPFPKVEWKKVATFGVRPDIQNDIYHLYCCNEKGEQIYHDVAYIPDYNTSLLMNRLFRKIKENENLDALEESDDEEEFENEKEDRFVYLDREYTMVCHYHYKFKKWVPLRISPAGSKLVQSKDLPFLEKNKH
jgi:hypothetical protein